MKFRSKVRGTIEAEPVQFAGADYVLADVGLAAPVAIPADVSMPWVKILRPD